MLILTRKTNEAIRIGDDVVIKIVEVNKRHVKIGIEAPRSVTINREEVYQKIQAENREAATTHTDSMKGIAGLLAGNKTSDPSAVNKLFRKK